ncbi:hypothetical protein HY345_03205 [Candidatus Microgenomates bacterium]|nr:hypothetical protein [Candidatus Microgenomates bacterium]
MQNSILKIAIVLILLVFAFGAGYFFHSQIQRCSSPVAATVPLSESSQTVPTTSSPSSSPSPSVAVQPETELLFSNYNSAAVANNPSGSTVFTVSGTRKIYLIQDYHWNSAQGKKPGTISLKSESGKVYGPWEAQGAPGQGGVPNAYWTVYPDTEIPAGTYSIIDSDPASWAHNSGTKGIGMSQVYAVK